MPRSDTPGLLLNTTDALQNDRIFISHRHDAEDGFPNLEDMGDGCMSDDQGSDSSSMQNSEQKVPGGSRSTRFIDSEVRGNLPACGTRY
jgi:hypothetical protein